MRIGCFILGLISVLTGVARGDEPGVLAHAAGDTQWVGRVVIVKNGDPTDAGPARQTRLYARQTGPGQQWRQLATVPGRAVMLAGRSTQLAVLLADGQWRTVWSESATGQTLPADGRMVALTDDGQSLWAIGLVDGGIRAAATRPTTAPTTAVVTTRPLARPVIFHEVVSQWIPIAEFPEDVTLIPGHDVSAIVDGTEPIVAFDGPDGSIRILRYHPDHHSWDHVDVPRPAAHRGGFFKLVRTDNGPILWLSDQTDGGDIYPSMASPLSPIHLAWTGRSKPADGPPTVAFAGGRLRAYTTDGSALFEQPISGDGKLIGPPAALDLPIDFDDSSVPGWIQAGFFASMTFSVGAVAVRQYGQARRPPAKPSPAPAPTSSRLAAGMVDLLPVAVPLMFLSSAMNADPTGRPSNGWAIAIGIGFAIYLLHTTIGEWMTGRTIGKKMFGLRVVDVAGGPASGRQLLVRNLLRPIDPLVLAIVSPLRQRTADVAAGTMVVADRTDDRRE